VFLKGNNIREEGAKLLNAAMMVNSTLTMLDLSGNAFGPEGTRNLAKTFGSQHNVLIELNFGGNNIGDEGSYALSKALLQSSSLKYLNLELNLIGNIGARDISTAMKSNTSLQQLDLAYNRIGVEGALNLKRSMGANFKEVVFVGNAIQNVTDLCKASLEELELVQPELQIESKIMLSKKGLSGFKAQRALSFQSLLSTAHRL